MSGSSNSCGRFRFRLVCRGADRVRKDLATVSFIPLQGNFGNRGSPCHVAF